MKNLFTIAQITDLHVGRVIPFPSGEIDLYDRLVKAVETINAMDPLPDILVVSGDLANHGNEDDYRRVKALFDTLRMPYFIVVGNHDQRSSLRSIFSEHKYLQTGSEYIQYALENFPVRIVAIDTLAVGSHRGLMDKERLDWLDRKLAEEKNKPTIVFMHHPPFETGMPYPDNLGMDGKEELGKIVEKYSNIEAVASGHTHREAVLRWHGTVAYTTPSSAFSYKLEFHDVDDLDPLLEPAAFRVFRWDPDTGLVSHMAYTGNYEFGITEGVPAPPEN